MFTLIVVQLDLFYNFSTFSVSLLIITFKQQQPQHHHYHDHQNIRRYLELQSSGRRDEIRFHFTYITPNGDKQVHTESFPYRLADYTWHRVALSISGAEIQLLVDCRPLYKRVMHFVPDRNFSASNLQLFIGQRNSYSHSLFKVIELLFSFPRKKNYIITQRYFVSKTIFVQNIINLLRHTICPFLTSALTECRHIPPIKVIETRIDCYLLQRARHLVTSKR